MRFVVSVLLVLAVLARALVPAGYMTQTSASGGIEIVICSGTDTETILVDANGVPIDPAEQPATDGGDTCPFALAALTTLTETGTDLPDFIRLPTRLHPLLEADQRVRIAILAINAARAPPILA